MSLTRRLSPRGMFAAGAGQAAGWASRTLGKGSGGMIGGRVALRLDPQIMRRLASGRQIILVTGTNGKSTTTKMVRAAIEGDVASNTFGDNMPPGITTALMTDAPVAALEVDEMHMPIVAGQVEPSAMILLNLSRDQLDRVGEIGTVEKRLRAAVDANPQAIIVANCDDPLIASAAWEAKNVIWVAAGASWGADSASFPRGGGRVLRDGTNWWVEAHPQYHRPEPDYRIETVDAQPYLVGADVRVPLNLSIPGDVNLANAAQALAVAHALGEPLEEAAERVAQVSAVAGRYETFDVSGRRTRLLLAKNPAGWQEALTMASAPSRVVAVNGQIPDGEDLSWLWDVNFESLTLDDGQYVLASGERGADLAVRLKYADIDAPLIPDTLEAILNCPEGDVDVLANYTAFRDLLSRLRRRMEEER